MAEKNYMTETYSASFSQRRISPRQGEHRLFAWSALSIAVLVFVGFSRTYYLHSSFGTPDLSMFLNVHGAVMTGWIVLFGVQTFLIASNHTRLHRVLGTFGLGYAALVVAIGSAATILAARREVRAHSVFVSSFLTVLALELTQMFLFASLVALGVWFRNRIGYHKRLMLLATICMLPNPLVRLFILVGIRSNIVILSLWALLVMAVVLVDSVRNRKLHPAFGVGGLVAVVLLYVAYFGSVTLLWQSFAVGALA
jgi:hypothetical protein